MHDRRLVRRRYYNKTYRRLVGTLLLPPLPFFPFLRVKNNNGGGDGGAYGQYHLVLCAYHEACVFMENKNNKHLDQEKPIPIVSKDELELLPTILRKIRPCDNLIARFIVPGVVENYPLLSMGDLIRLRFTEAGISNEIIGQIIDVVIKTEMVTILLLPPFDRIATPGVLPYLQAMLSTKDRCIDVGFLIDRPPIDPMLSANNAVAGGGGAVTTSSEIIPESKKKHIRRFDVRFSFLGGRGFDMAQRTLSYVLHRTRNKSTGKDHVDNLTRVLVPTLEYATSAKDVSTRSQQQMVISNWSWSTQINAAQRIAVVDIVLKNHGTSPHIIFGPAGTMSSLTSTRPTRVNDRAATGGRRVLWLL